jgi:hypothetical protein
VTSFNVEGSAVSQSSGFYLGAVPSAPTVAPIEVSKSISKIIVSVTALTTEAQTGGLPILRYEIQVDSGNGNGYQTLQNSTDLQASFYEVVKGRTYGFRYRALNVVGLGAFSSITYIQAVDVPSAPESPKILAFSNSEVTLQLFNSDDNGGVPIDGFYIELAPSSTMTFVPVTTYTSSSMQLTHTLTVADNSLVVGEVYYFRTRSHNSVGYSPYSEELTSTIAIVNLPSSVSALSVDYSLSEKTSLFFKWNLLADSTISPLTGGIITGYELQLDDGLGGDFKTVFNGVGQPGLNFYLAMGLPNSLHINARV